MDSKLLYKGLGGASFRYDSLQPILNSVCFLFVEIIGVDGSPQIPKSSDRVILSVFFLVSLFSCCVFCLGKRFFELIILHGMRLRWMDFDPLGVCVS